MKEVQVLTVIELDLPANITFGATYYEQVFSNQHGRHSSARYKVELIIVLLDPASECDCVDVDLVFRDCDCALAPLHDIKLGDIVVRSKHEGL